MNEIKKDKNKFYIGENSANPIAEITFIPTDDDKLIVNHTYVSDSLRGQGIAMKLVEKVIEYARAENKKIVPVCSYVYKVMANKDEYKDILE